MNDLLNLPNQTFSTAEIAEMLKISPQAVNKRAHKRGWIPAPGKIQGGGSVWTFSGLDQETKDNLSACIIHEHRAENPPVTLEQQRRIDAMWQEFDKKPDSIKERAFKWYDILIDVPKLIYAGSTAKAAIAAVAQTHGVKIGTVRNKYFGAGGKQGVKDIDPKDWLPFLADDHKGRVAFAPCDEIAWEFFKKDYLRREKPSLSSSYRRVKKAAEAYGWVIPSCRTLCRRLYREIPLAVIKFMRTGKLENDYPDQKRRRDAFQPGQAVSCDVLSFDTIYVYDEATGEVFNPRGCFLEDICTGKTYLGAIDKTENSDMLRRGIHTLTGEFLPQHIYIDNTRAVANKCLTGQVKGRHRFKFKADDPVGLLKRLNIEVHFTNPDHEISSPGSKPIERAFGIGGLHSSMREWPSLKDRATFKNPIPYSEFVALLPEVVAEHNSREGRTGGICNGRSFDQVFADGLRNRTSRKCSAGWATNCVSAPPPQVTWKPSSPPGVSRMAKPANCALKSPARPGRCAV